MKRQAGFTLLELVIALAIFAMIGLASARLYESVIRTDIQVGGYEQQLRSLQRAMSVLERDLAQVAAGRDEPSVALQSGYLKLRRGNWRNPLDLPRSERLLISYGVVDGTLWRYSLSPELEGIQEQRLLEDVRGLQWRFYDKDTGWRTDWSQGSGQRVVQPGAVEVTLSVGRFEQIRRVILLPEGV